MKIPWSHSLNTDRRTSDPWEYYSDVESNHSWALPPPIAPQSSQDPKVRKLPENSIVEIGDQLNSSETKPVKKTLKKTLYQEKFGDFDNDFEGILN